MKYYYYLYCRGYDWYNTTGKKDKDTLRVSSITLLSAMPSINILTAILLVCLLIRQTIISKWGAVAIYGLFFVFNLLLISSRKSDTLRAEYQSLASDKKKQINRVFYLYLFISILFLVFMLAYTAYFKHIYGNYDLEK